MDLTKRLSEILKRYDSLSEEMGRPDMIADRERLQQLAREQSALEEHAQLARDWLDVERGLADARELAESGDRELEELARDEIAKLEPRRAEIEARALDELSPRDPNDEKNVVVEIRAGTGGDEA